MVIQRIPICETRRVNCNSIEFRKNVSLLTLMIYHLLLVKVQLFYVVKMSMVSLIHWLDDDDGEDDLPRTRTGMVKRKSRLN